MHTIKIHKEQVNNSVKKEIILACIRSPKILVVDRKTFLLFHTGNHYIVNFLKTMLKG